MGQALAKVLADLLKLKSAGRLNTGMEMVSQNLQSELDIDLHSLLAMSEDELRSYVKSKRLHAYHLELLADMFVELAHGEPTTGDTDGKQMLTMALKCLDLADHVSNSHSFDRMQKRDAILLELES